MTKYLLVSFKTCPWVQRSAIVLREKKIDFEFRHIERDNRPDWFLAISPHKKVPVLRVDDTVSLFEFERDQRISRRDDCAAAASRGSGAARDQPRLDRLLPTFADQVTGVAYADDEADGKKCLDEIPQAFERLERALEKQGAGPFFNGAKYSLVDAAYAPFLQRYYYLDRIRPIGQIEKYPRLKAWADTLIKRPSTHSFPEAEFEALYRLNVQAPQEMAVAVHRGARRWRRSRWRAKIVAQKKKGKK